MRKEFLLGIEKNVIFTGELEITERNGYKEFTACFNIGEAFDVGNITEDYKDNYLNSYWDCLDSDSKLNLLEDGEITKEEVFKKWEYETEYRDIINCSCTDFEIVLENMTTINFETFSCGQCDIREHSENFENITFTNKEAVLLLLELWDSYHLKNIEEDFEEIEKKIIFICEKLEKFNVLEEDFKEFIKQNIEL